MELQTFDPSVFVRDHWQRQPLLIRNPWADWANPLAPDDLAGLACDDDLESRLIVGGDGDWRVEHGPFAAARFTSLGDSPWTLLVNAVDHAVPAVAALLAPFRFLPDWRIDDVMVSYATDGGGVGPHFDRYDVFLVQGLGRRRWRIGGPCDATTPLRPHDDLRLLADFAATDEWVLEPGDILYLPPGIAHDGVAVGGDCMTYSIGFRAPSRGDLVGGWADAVLARLADDDRYADPAVPAQANPGEITADAIAQLHALALAPLADRAAFARWFGTHVSTPKYDLDWAPKRPATAASVRARLAKRAAVTRNPASRFAFVRVAHGVELFVDGHVFVATGATAALVEALCAGPVVAVTEPLGADALTLLVALVNAGSVTI